MLAEIADALRPATASRSSSVWQEGSGDEAQLVFVTHRAREGAFQTRRSQQLRGAVGRARIQSVLRVEGEE